MLAILNSKTFFFKMTFIYTVFHKKNTPLAFLLYLSQMLLNDSENWL